MGKFSSMGLESNSYIGAHDRIVTGTLVLVWSHDQWIQEMRWDRQNVGDHSYSFAIFPWYQLPSAAISYWVFRQPISEI